MTNRTAPQLRADAAALHAQADALDLDRQAAVVAGDATRAWTLRARSATLRAEARFATAHADHLDAQAETAATGLLVPMTRETGGTVEAPAETDAPIVWCDNVRHPITGHTQRLNCLRPTSTPDGDTSVAPLTRADLDALPENPGQSAREALNLLRIGDTGGEPDQLAGEVLRYFAHLERQDVAEAERADVENPDDPDNDLDDLDVREAMRVELARTLGVDPRTAASVWGNLINVVAGREQQREALLRGVE